jgi:hypothetical protein
MKKILGIALLVAAGAFIVFMTGCEDGELPNAPTNLEAKAINEGLGIELSWTGVTDADDYTVYFNGELLEEEITVTYYQHVTDCEPGTYVVTAFIGSEESDDSDALSTEPIAIADKQVWELNGAGSSGIEFDVLGNAIATWSMEDESHQGKIDCYFSDWALGYGSTPYYIVSANQVGDDPGNTWLDADGWRETGISDYLTANIGDVTEVPFTGYYSSSEVVTGETYATYTEDGYYGLIQVISVSTANGQVDIKATFQLVEEFRLF